MTIWETMTTLLREILLTGEMVLILLLGYLTMAIWPLRGRQKMTALTAAVAVFNLVLFYLLLDCVFHYGDPKKPRIWPTKLMLLQSIIAKPRTIASRVNSQPMLPYKFMKRPPKSATN